MRASLRGLAVCALVGCGGGTAADDGGLSDGGALADAAAQPDSSSAGARIGAAALAQRAYMQAPATGTLATGPVATRAGSTLLVSLARGTWSAAPDAPSDSFGNSYARLGEVHSYAAWPTSATALYQRTSAAGGANLSFAMTWGDIGGGDEVSLSAVEVIGGDRIEDTSWVERPAAGSITSASVHVSGQAILVAWWWGSGGVRPPGAKHVAAPGGGFQLIPAATGLTSISSSGYIQVACAWRLVTAPGDYTVTWTTDNEGAQLYLVAVHVP